MFKKIYEFFYRLMYLGFFYGLGGAIGGFVGGTIITILHWILNTNLNRVIQDLMLGPMIGAVVGILIGLIFHIGKLEYRSGIDWVLIGGIGMGIGTILGDTSIFRYGDKIFDPLEMYYIIIFITSGALGSWFSMRLNLSEIKDERRIDRLSSKSLIGYFLAVILVGFVPLLFLSL